MDPRVLIAVCLILVVGGTASAVSAWRRRKELIDERRDKLRGVVEDAHLDE